jgi:excinuclease ABC subunit A
MVCFPLPLSARVTHALVVENLRALGFVRVLADGGEIHLDELPRAWTSRAPASCWWWWTA